MNANRLLGPLVALVVLHSAALGLAAVVAPEWGLRFTGFGTASPMFFARQVGVFHVVVAIAYAIEWRRYRGVSILLMAKTTAVLFLALELANGPRPWIVPVSLAGDAAMAVAVALLAARARGR
ncbi:MAG: hypothetical protein U0704_10735 [Candidatus Eisenbacteria bacterium]